MNNIKYYFLNSSIGSKLILYFFLVILLPVITITSLGDLLYKNSINDEQNVNTHQMIGQISNNVDFYIKDTENIINYLSDDPRVMKFLIEKQINKENNSDIDNASENAIRSFTKLHPEIAGIMIVNKNDMFVSDIMYRISRDPLIKEKWYLQAINNPNKVQLFSKPIGRNINNIFQFSADDVVSMSKAVINNKTGECLGVILIDMKLDIIKSVIENVKPGKTGFVYIVDHNGEIVYAPVNKVVYRIKDDWLFSLDNKIIHKLINGKDYELMCMSSAYTGWKTVGVFPLDESQKVISFIKYYSFLIALCTLIFAGILAIIFTKSIVNPITKLRRLMKRTEEGDLDVHFNNKYNDEIGELGNSFNNMIREIKKLINLVQSEEKNKRKAEISILQAQIKPHFLYNTLDTIQWMAQEHGAEDIMEMVRNLTNLLRIGLSSGAEVIKLHQEIMHVESYLTIQKVRYGDKLNYKISIEEGIIDYNVIKLILQPLVENSIYHGIKERRGNGLITIKGEKIENKIHLSISDDGIGIKEEKLKEINNFLRSKNAPNNIIGFGIYNVNEKIRLTYGDEFGLEYHSIYGKGTTVDIWHPIIK